MVSECRSVNAVSLNVGGGIPHNKPAKLYMCTQKHYKHYEDGRMAPGDWITHTRKSPVVNFKQLLVVGDQLYNSIKLFINGLHSADFSDQMNFYSDFIRHYNITFD